jgi:hypothetical protein
MNYKEDQSVNQNNNIHMSAGTQIFILSVVIGALCLLFALIELRQWAEQRKWDVLEKREAPVFNIQPLVGDVTGMVYSVTSDDISQPYIDLKENKLAEKERKSHGKKRWW